MKAKCNSWETTNEAAYVDPRLQRNPALLANVDLALDEDHPELPVAVPSPLLKCWNCNVRSKRTTNPFTAQRSDKTTP